MVDISCGLCGAASKTPLLVCEDKPSNENRVIVRCAACGLVYVSPRKLQPYEAIDAAWYERDYFPKVSIQVFIDLIDSVERLAPRRGALLELGCSVGYLLDVARARGWSVSGVDPSTVARDWARKYLQLDVRPAPASACGFEPGSFDAVVAVEVIEHLADPLAALREVRPLMKPGGLLFLTTPNIDSKAFRDLGRKWPPIDPFGHIYYFIPETMRLLLDKAGFDCAELTATGGAAGDEQLQVWARPKDAQAAPVRTCFEDLTEEIPDDLLPPLDKREVDESRLTPDQKTWRDEGCLILRGFIPPEVIDPYCRLREKLGQPGGWRTATPYMHYPEIRDLGCYGPLTDKLKELISQDMGMHLNLTGWVSTERNWHQDDYLNPPFINSWYTAVWFALDKISADAGPFEYVPGSHKWRALRGQKVLERLTPKERTDPSWPKYSERILNPVFEEEIEKRGTKPRRFLADKGDVLIWHGRLAHRGSAAKVPGMQRKAFIAHYSALSKRIDMPRSTRHGTAGWYFQLDDAPPTPSERAAVEGPQGWRNRLRRLLSAVS